ncbi:MAG: translocation/assembly module TamB domain-containing protein [Acidobacteria bacterium]|nr:translocation/assembly module TamB domain-containing protein [Acidobacteriota bacterium]
MKGLSWKRIALAAGASALILLGTAVAILRSDWLLLRIRQTIVEEIARTTGARAEIGQLGIHWRTLTFHAQPFILHGGEGAAEPPLLVARSVDVDLSLQGKIDAVLVEHLRIHLIVYPDGSTNLPGTAQGKPDLQPLFDIALGRLEVRDGELRLAEQRIPLNFRAEGLRLNAALAAQQYRGQFAVAAIEPYRLGVSTQWQLSPTRLQLDQLELQYGASKAAGRAELKDWAALQASANLDVTGDVTQLSRLIKLDAVRDGTISGPVQLSWTPAGWRADGNLAARGVTLTLANETVRGLTATAQVEATPQGLHARNLVASLLGGEFLGEAQVASATDYRLAGRVKGIRLPHDLSAMVDGTLDLRGAPLKLDTDLTLTALSGPLAVSGGVELHYAAADGGVLRLGPSSLVLGSTRLNARGSLPAGLDLQLRTRNPADVLPVLKFILKEPPKELPVAVRTGGELIFTGRAEGKLEEISVESNFEGRLITVAGQPLDRITGQLAATSKGVNFVNTTATRAGLIASGAVEATLDDWRLLPSSALQGQVTIRTLDLSTLALTRTPVTGTASGTFALTGTWSAPQAEGELRIEKPAYLGYSFDRLSSRFQATLTSVELANAELVSGSSKLTTQLTWGEGRDITFNGSSPGWQFEQGTASGQARGRLRLTDGRPDMLALDGQVKANIRGVETSVRVASTSGGVELTGDATLDGAKLSLRGTWSLGGQMPGKGQATLAGVTPALLSKLLGIDIPFGGLIEGTARIEGRLLDPRAIVAQVALKTVRLTPLREDVVPGMTAADLTLANQGDIVFALSPQGLAVEKARLIAKDTQLDALGTINFTRDNAWNFLLRGGVNLAVFRAIRPDLISAGASTVNARIRGPLKNPQVEGRMQLRDASFYLRGVANGLDKVNGTVLFDRSRATIESLNAETGGGKVSLGGFVGFGQDVSYQLQGMLDRVRIRYPEGVSTQVNASVTLTGTTRRSLLSGTVTILRAALTPSTDLGGLLARPVQPLTSAPQNDFLRNMTLDVRVDTAQSAEFATELTRDVQADIDLRLRGTPARPVVLGRVSITQGRIVFFGTDYTINRGEIDFVNPVRLDPQVDLDLETRIRGIVVSLSFAGPISRLNMSYRSDPPLQSSEILALLAVGRTPGSTTSNYTAPGRSADPLSAGGNAILDSAISASSGGRLQRFFGISRLKIDPQLIGIDNTPQARLTVEQQVSRDVTVTYITNLNRAQQQIVRVAWDLSRQFSAIMTRDENGVLSVDFVYKQSFK